MNTTVHDIICSLFAIRDLTHQLHLKTRSFAKHMALNDLYDTLLTSLDDIAEVYQGKYGLLDMTKCEISTAFSNTDEVAFIAELARWAEECKTAFDPQDTHLLNDWDVVISAVYRAKYKIDNLQ